MFVFVSIAIPLLLSLPFHLSFHSFAIENYSFCFISISASVYVCVILIYCSEIVGKHCTVSPLSLSLSKRSKKKMKSTPFETEFVVEMLYLFSQTANIIPIYLILQESFALFKKINGNLRNISTSGRSLTLH